MSVGAEFHLPLVTLREITAADALVLEELDAPETRGAYDSYDDPPEQMLRAQNFGGGAKIVCREDATPIGNVSWIQVPHGPNTKSLAWSIGICLLRAHRGSGYGAAAQRLLSDELFQTSSAHRVEASTDIHNIAEQRSLYLAGFTFEGVLRGAMWRRGAWHDQMIFSRLRDD